MRVLIFHGYLLRGTGSNVYNAELAQALLRAGHDVDLVCQEKLAGDLEWVDALGRWDHTGALVVEDLARDPRPESRGRCTVFLPPIADLLPVYVQDNYKDFTAKTFDQLDDQELEFYIARNVMAVKAVAERARPDCALANHMVMGPYILAKALDREVPYAVKIHGSAMEYMVRPHPDRFLPYARTGVDGATAILVGSRHIAERTWDTLRISGLEQRVWLGPPGVDVERFKPLPREKALAGLAEAGEAVLGLPRLGYGPAQRQATASFLDRVRTAARSEGVMSYDDVAAEVADLQRNYENAGIDIDAGDALRAMSSTDVPTALYVGKLIVSKGVDLLAAAWPLVRARHPQARLVITGFGAYREGFEMLVTALSEGDLTTARWIATGGRAFEGGATDPLKLVLAFLDSLAADEEARETYLAAARGMRESIVTLGRLEHDLLSRVIPAADCQIVPSTFPEAFGMVAAEAAACGVPPISADHSGLAEVTAELQKPLSGASASLLSFRLSGKPINQLADRINATLALSADQRAEMSARLSQTARERFSWDRVAGELVDAAEGRTEALRRP